MLVRFTANGKKLAGVSRGRAFFIASATFGDFFKCRGLDRGNYSGKRREVGRGTWPVCLVAPAIDMDDLGAIKDELLAMIGDGSDEGEADAATQ